MPAKLITFPLLILAMLTALAAANIAQAARPDNCAPEHREVRGNTNSPCQWDFRAHLINTVEYAVVENVEGNSCREQITFKPFNASAEQNALASEGLSLSAIVEFTSIKSDGTPGSANFRHKLQYIYDAIFTSNSIKINTGIIHTLESRVAQNARWGSSYDFYPHKNYDVMRIVFNHGGARNHQSSWIPIPANIADFNLLMNDCLAGIKQRLENEAKLEETRQRVEAERIAQERAAAQAAAEAERQRLETEAAREALRLARETELAKTKALIEQLEKEKIIIEIWQEVVTEKQKGAQERAEITNRYLTDIETNTAEFKAGVVEKASEIRRLEEINNAIITAIIAHNDEIEQHIANQAQREAELQQKLDNLTIQPTETPPTPQPTQPTPTPEPPPPTPTPTGRAYDYPLFIGRV